MSQVFDMELKPKNKHYESGKTTSAGTGRFYTSQS